MVYEVRNKEQAEFLQWMTQNIHVYFNIHCRRWYADTWGGTNFAPHADSVIEEAFRCGWIFEKDDIDNEEYGQYVEYDLSYDGEKALEKWEKEKENE